MDWLELPEAPWGAKAHLLQDTLSHSTKFRSAFAESEEQAHLIEATPLAPMRLTVPDQSHHLSICATKVRSHGSPNEIRRSQNQSPPSTWV